MFILSACVDLWTGSGLLNISNFWSDFHKSRSRSYTSANFLQAVCCFRVSSWIYEAGIRIHAESVIGICYTYKLIWTISWINYVCWEVHRWYIKRVSNFAYQCINACSESGAPEPKSAPRWSKSAIFVHGFWRCSEMRFSDTEVSALWTVCEGSVSALCKLRERSVSALWMLCERTVSALSVRKRYSLWRHWHLRHKQT